ncbi:hypothetical protein IJK16_02900 [Candidatus Saccharibacteria bacterium]|nr:hypothetical protein [Candidatus Saccharibacteria bacterium]
MNNKKNEPNIIRVIVNCFFILATLCFAVLGIENLKPLLTTGDPTTNNCQYNETSCDYIMLQSGFHQELSVSTASTIAVVSFATVVMNIGILAVYNRR